VSHHVEVASMPNDVGSTLEREIVQLSADRLVLGSRNLTCRRNDGFARKS